jgi:ribonucleotide monophosphatase NagD (HAD superfamily)
MFDILKKYHGLDESRTMMIGDRLDTDIAFGIKSDMKYTMAVLSGVTCEQDLVGTNDKKESLLPNFYCQSLLDFANFI